MLQLFELFEFKSWLIAAFGHFVTMLLVKLKGTLEPIKTLLWPRVVRVMNPLLVTTGSEIACVCMVVKREMMWLEE